MKPLKVLAVAVLLTGCAANTVADLRQRDPVVVADSMRSVEDIGSCIAQSTEKLGSANYLPNPHGATVTVQTSAGAFGGEVPMLTADIENMADHRHVTIWLFETVWAKRNRHQIEGLRTCL